MECEQMKENVEINSIENTSGVREDRERQSEIVTQNLSPLHNANCLIPNGGNQDKETTSTNHDAASFTTEKIKTSGSRRIGRFRFRSMSSPVMILRNDKGRAPATKGMEEREEKEEEEVEEEEKRDPDEAKGEWKMRRHRHVSFDECVHVLTKCSVVQMPLRESSMIADSSHEDTACHDDHHCDCEQRAGCFKKRVEFPDITKKVAFSWEEMLKVAVLEHDLSEVERLCQQWETNVNKKLSNGLTPLHISSVEGCFRVLQYILNQGGCVDATDDQGWTPLHYAALHGNVPCALLLLRAGANIDSRTKNCETAIELASDEEMILLLGMIMNGGGLGGVGKGHQNKETYV